MFDSSLRYALSAFGFQFNPFEHLEASQDPRLGEYLIGHEALELVSKPQAAQVFALPGAGKTALRIAVGRACALAFGGQPALPVSYNLPELFPQLNPPPAPDAHTAAILRRAALSLLIGLSFRPELFLSRSPSEQNALTRLLRSLLRTPPLEYYLGMLRNADPRRLAERFDRTYAFLTPPAPRPLTALCQQLSAASTPLPFSPDLRRIFFEQVQALGFKAIFILLDGADGFAGSIEAPDQVAEALQPLLREAADWASQGWVIKAFLPMELRPYQSDSTAFQTIALDWQDDELIRVLQRRIYIASQGQTETFDAFCDGLRGIEAGLVGHLLRPLPREAICLANTLLHTFAERAGRGGEALCSADIEQAIQRYSISLGSPVLQA